MERSKIINQTILLCSVLGLILFSSMMLPSGSFNDILANNPSEYANYQIKLTYTGSQTKATPTLLLVGNSRTADISEFIPYQSPNVHYGNDGGKIFELNVSGTTIEKFISGLLSRPYLQVIGGDPDPLISLMIERGAPPNEIVFEHLADDIESDELMNILQGSVRNESANIRELARVFRNITVGPN